MILSVLEPGDFGLCLAVAYLLSHLVLCLAARRRTAPLPSTVLIDLSVATAFAGLLFWGRPEDAENQWLLFLRLWAPVVFFWWAYKWSGVTLHSFYPADFSFDAKIMGWEKKFLGQPSLWMARRQSAGLGELMHFFYATYYFYTPAVGGYLYAHGRLKEFETMAAAVMIGYAVSYILFALVPVWGPRWGLLTAGLLKSSEQQIRGYWLTRTMNRIMYGGLAHKGGAMPSSHSSTAVVFLFWCWKLWGFGGGVPATLMVGGMWVASVYGRYHYVADILCGAILGLVSIYLADALIP